MMDYDVVLKQSIHTPEWIHIPMKEGYSLHIPPTDKPNCVFAVLNYIFPVEETKLNYLSSLSNVRETPDEYLNSWTDYFADNVGLHKKHPYFKLFSRIVFNI